MPTCLLELKGAVTRGINPLDSSLVVREEKAGYVSKFYALGLGLGEDKEGVVQVTPRPQVVCGVVAAPFFFVGADVCNIHKAGTRR